MRMHRTKLLRRAVELNRNYDANGFLDALKARFGFQRDAELCRALLVTSPLLSKIRAGVCPVSAEMMLRIHDALGIGINEQRALMKIEKPVFPEIQLKGQS